MLKIKSLKLIVINKQSYKKLLRLHNFKGVFYILKVSFANIVDLIGIIL